METRQLLKETKYFSERELRCKCGCKKMLCKSSSILKLISLRDAYGIPMPVSSGYRCKMHPDEQNKDEPGTGPHCRGEGFDIKVRSRYDRARLVHLAIIAGFKGIGVSTNFVHLDDRAYFALWIYPNTK